MGEAVYFGRARLEIVGPRMVIQPATAARIHGKPTADPRRVLPDVTA
jgi:hypothetical protein